jgi:hypothetical protein
VVPLVLVLVVDVVREDVTVVSDTVNKSLGGNCRKKKIPLFVRSRYPLFNE